MYLTPVDPTDQRSFLECFFCNVLFPLPPKLSFDWKVLPWLYQVLRSTFNQVLTMSHLYLIKIIPGTMPLNWGLPWDIWISWAVLATGVEATQVICFFPWSCFNLLLSLKEFLYFISYSLVTQYINLYQFCKVLNFSNPFHFGMQVLNFFSFLVVPFLPTHTITILLSNFFPWMLLGNIIKKLFSQSRNPLHKDRRERKNSYYWIWSKGGCHAHHRLSAKRFERQKISPF